MKTFHSADSPLSIWYPCTFIVGTTTYNCALQYYLVLKAQLFADEFVEEILMKLDDPKAMMSIGRQVDPFDKDLWIETMSNALRVANREKFQQNPDLLAYLLRHDDYVEACEDRVYGCGYVDGEIPDDRSLWGMNLMGKCLNELREELK